jgi:hypothetical protein
MPLLELLCPIWWSLGFEEEGFENECFENEGIVIVDGC